MAFAGAWLFILLSALAAGAVLLSVGPVQIGSAEPVSEAAHNHSASDPEVVPQTVAA